MPPCPEIVNYWWKWYPPVGVFIACVAVIAFIFPVIYDAEHRVTRTKKLIWTGIVALLVAFEIRSTYYDRKGHDAEQAKASCEQLHSFQEIAGKLETDISENRQHFDATMEQEKGILGKERATGELAQRNLENLTGGQSFAYAIPSMTRGDGATLMLYNAGNEMLTGIHVIIEKVINDCPQPRQPTSKCYPQFDSGMMHPIDIGQLGPKEGITIPTMMWFQTRPDGTGHYNIRIYAQNGQGIEEIWLRPGKTPDHHEYKFHIFRRVHGKLRKGDYQMGPECYRELKTVDWTDGSDMAPDVRDYKR